MDSSSFGFSFNAPMFADFSSNPNDENADPDSFFFPKSNEPEPKTEESCPEEKSCSRSRSRSSARRTSEVLNSINQEELLNIALESLTVSAKKKKSLASRKSIFGGIELDPEVAESQNKEHPMETRRDRAIRTPKLELRSRSVVKTPILNIATESSRSRKRKSIHLHVPSVSNPNIIEQGANDEDSSDEAIPAIKKEKLSPAICPMPHPPSARRTVTFSEVKFEPRKSLLAASDAKVPYNFTGKHEGSGSALPGARKRLLLTEPKTPQFRSARRAMRTSNRVAVISNTGGVNTVKYQSVYHSGVPSNYRPVARNYTNQTQLKPFSFDERDRRMLERKEQKIKELLEEEKNKAKFHANPLPPFIMEKKEIPIPSTRGYALSRQSTLHKYEQNEKENPTTFKAHPPTVLHKEPFIPKKADRPLLEIPDFELKTERRAREREQFELHMKEREAQMESALRERELQEKKREEEEIARLRKEAVHKANPVPKYLPPRIIQSLKPLTEPMSPKFSSRLRRQ